LVREIFAPEPARRADLGIVFPPANQTDRRKASLSG
jgi:hypothetical protein